MDEIWIEVQMSADCKSAFITDWTFYMRAWFVDNPRTYSDYHKKFTPVVGKYLTINVMGFNNYERCKSFAIWYITNRELCIPHRLDCIYSTPNKREKRRKRVSPATRL